MKQEAAELHRRILLASRHASAARDLVSRRRFPAPSNDPAGPRLDLRQEIGDGTAAVWLSVGGLQRAARLAGVIAAGGATYFAALWLLGFRVSDSRGAEISLPERPVKRLLHVCVRQADRNTP